MKTKKTTTSISNVIMCVFLFLLFACSKDEIPPTNEGPQNLPPTLDATAINNITEFSALFNGIITDVGSASITKRGFCWSTNQNPSISNYLEIVENVNSSYQFSNFITNLFPDRSYYVVSYATNSYGTSYGTQKEFSTTNDNVYNKDDFELYSAGQSLLNQTYNIIWETANGAAGSSQDPIVSSTQVYNGTKSIKLQGENNLFREFNSYDKNWIIMFKMHIPSGYLGSFQLLQTRGGMGMPYWGMIVRFDKNGYGKLDAGGQNAATFSFEYGNWTSIMVEIDLELDQAYFYFNSNLVHDWQWSLGADGQSGLTEPKFSGVNFFTWDENGTPLYYIDDFVLLSIQ